MSSTMALPPLLLESATAHFQAGPSNRFEGLCPFPGHLSPHRRHSRAAPADSPDDPRCGVACRVTPQRLRFRSSELLSPLRDHRRVTDTHSWERLPSNAPRGASATPRRSHDLRPRCCFSGRGLAVPGLLEPSAGPSAEPFAEPFAELPRRIVAVSPGPGPVQPVSAERAGADGTAP